MNTAVAKTVKTTCPYCGVGCGVDAPALTGRQRDPQLIAVSGDSVHPANFGHLCVKGSALHETTGLEGRLLHPRVNGERVDWDRALDTVADGFSRIVAEHGPGAVAFYLSGQLLTEDYYVANKLMKGFIGSANIDTNSRLCMSSAVAGYKRAFGEDVVPCSYEDLECCDLLVMVGSNAAWTHPVLYQRIAAAKAERPDMRVVVIDPRATATCDIADLHLAIAPGSDAFVFAGLLNHLCASGAIDSDYIAAHTEGFAQALAVAAEQDLDAVAAIADVDVNALAMFYRWFADTEKTVTFYSQGVNQSATGTDKSNAIINCHLATGRIGRPGMGPFSITGQPNAMGGREVGGLANQLAAHMDFDPADVDRVKRFWHAPNMAEKPGLKAVELFDAIERGEVKAVWIMATNPVVSLPDADRARRALEQCELVVVSDCIADTDTTACADVLLPATGWGEKNGTVTNSERRISRQRPLRKPAGEARHDWWIVSRVAQRMGFGEAFDYSHSHQVFCEHAGLSGFENDGKRQFDISGLAKLSQQNYDAMSPVQWPVNAAYSDGAERLFGDGVFSTASGRARFLPVVPKLPELRPGGDTPFVLNTGRIRDQWHTMTRTALAPRLLNHIDAPFAALNPADATRLGLGDGMLAEIVNGRGAVRVEVRLDDGIRPGEVFAPMHWNGQFSSRGRVGALIPPVTDPHSGQPESKTTPVAVRPLPVARWVSVASAAPLNLDSADYWVKVPVAHGHRYRIALLDGRGDASEWIESLAGEGHRLVFDDSQGGASRVLVTDADRVLLMAFASPDRNALPDDGWLGASLGQPLPDQPWLLMAGRDAGGEEKGRLICSCFEVGEKQIARAIADGTDSVKALGEQLCCGTNCGSCIPELKSLIRAGADSRQSDAA